MSLEVLHKANQLIHDNEINWGIKTKLKGITPNLGDRNKEINTYIENNNLDKENCLVLDDEEDIVKNVICNYYITNYKTGIVESDINKIVKILN